MLVVDDAGDNARDMPENGCLHYRHIALCSLGLGAAANKHRIIDLSAHIQNVPKRK